MSHHINIGFSFSGGGARAAAHIGVLQAFRENGIHANHVAGTSGGAIVAALYAAGVNPKKMLELASRGSLFKLITAGIPLKGLTRLDYLEELLKEFIDTSSFDQLKIKLSIIAANLQTGEKAIFNTGELYPAVMASCAIPLVFKPIEIDKQLYTDGGVLDNMPVEPLQKDCDFIIGVNVMPNQEIKQDNLGNMVTIGMRVFDMAASNSSLLNYPACDFVIEPRGVLKHNVFSFGAFQELFDAGYEATKEQIPELYKKLFHKKHQI